MKLITLINTLVLNLVYAQNLIPTHFAYDRLTGYKNVEYRYVTITQNSGDLNATEMNLQTCRGYITHLFEADKWQNQALEPIRGQSMVLLQRIDQILYTIQAINDLATEKISRNKRSAVIYTHCNIAYQTNTTATETATIGLARLLTHAKAEIQKIVETVDVTAEDFKETQEFYDCSNLLTDCHMLVDSIHIELTDSQTRLVHLLQHEVDPQTKRQLRKKPCLQQDIGYIQTYKIEACTQADRKLSCELQLTLGQYPKPIYHMKPFRFSGCYIDKDVYIDGQKNLYEYNERGVLTTGPRDPCVEAIIHLNLTTITSTCPFAYEQKSFQFGYRALVINEITDDLAKGLNNLSITIGQPPFIIREGTYTMKLRGVSFSINHNKELTIETPILPFERIHLCPKPEILAFFSKAYLSIHWQTFVINIILLVISSATLFCLYKCVISRCRNKTRTNTPSNRELQLRDEDFLLSLANRPIQRRR